MEIDRVQTGQTLGSELAHALVQAQVEYESIDRTKSGYNYKYAPLEVVRRAVLPTLHKHGLAVMQYPVSDDDRVGVTTYLVHQSGEYVQETFMTRLPKTDPQSVGAAITYYRRYSLLACLGLAPEDEDTDASEFTANVSPSPSGDSEVDPAEYVVSFGKFKGRKLRDIDDAELNNWTEWLQGNGKLNGPAKEAVAAVALYRQDHR